MDVSQTTIFKWEHDSPPADSLPRISAAFNIEVQNSLDLGSALAGPDGQELWGTAPSVLFKNFAALGSRLDALELQSDDPEVDDIGDGIRPTWPIADLHLMPGLWKIDGYTKIRATLVDRFGLDPGRNFFELAYDWRRDNRVAARALARQAPRWLEEWRGE